MTVVDTRTGEITEPLTEAEAERLSTRIGLRLDTIADNYTAVMPMLREAVARQAYAALGYRSPGEYISERFGDALSQLGVEVRREVVRELTEAGLSTRAIAPVVGVSKSQVATDREVSSTGQVIGLDGKTYPRSEPDPVKQAVAEFPDLAYYAETGRASDVLLMAGDLRRYAERGELEMRLDILRRSITLDRSKRDGTYQPVQPESSVCPTCGQTTRSTQ